MDLTFPQKKMMVQLGHHLLIVFVAILAGYIIVLQRTTRTWEELKDKPFFYLSLLGSSLIAFALIHYIRVVTDRQTNSIAFSNGNRRGLEINFAYRVLSAMLLAICLATLLYRLNGEHITLGVYYNKLFILIVLFVLMVNFLYSYFYAIKPTENEMFISSNLPEDIGNTVAPPTPDVPEVVTIQTILPLDPIVPALIYMLHKHSHGLDFEGNYVTWGLSLEDSVKALSPDDYLRIHKSYIIHRDMIKEVEKTEVGKTITPIIETPHGLVLTISRRNLSSFDRWWACKTAPDEHP